MTPEQLRASILQQAMEGKLVKQDSTDEPASKLLEKIKAKKEQLDREKKIKKTKTLPEITEDEKPFDIPDSWEWTRLDKIAITINGDRSKNYPGKAYWISEGVPFINAGAVGNKYLNKTKFNYISDERYELLRSGFIEKNDILYCIRGSLGKNSISTVSKGAIASSLIIIRLISDDIRSDYLWYALNSSIGTDFVKEHRNGSAQPNIPGKDVLKMRLPLPPKIEQQRIVAKIEKLMPLVDEYEKAYNRLKSIDDGFNDKMKQSILQYAMEGKLVKQDPTDESASELLKKIKNEKIQLIKEKKIKRSKRLPEITDDEKKFDIPNSWEWVRLGEIGAITSGGTPKTTEKSYWEKAKIPWITPAVMSSQINGIVFQNTEIKYINKNGLEHSSAQLIPAYSIVVSSRAPIGYVNIVPYEYTTNQGCKSVTTFSNVNKEFIYYTIKYSVPDMYKRASGTTFKEISGTKFGQTIIPLPPLNEQKRIVTKIKELMSLIE